MKGLIRTALACLALTIYMFMYVPKYMIINALSICLQAIGMTAISMYLERRKGLTGKFSSTIDGLCKRVNGEPVNPKA